MRRRMSRISSSSMLTELLTLINEDGVIERERGVVPTLVTLAKSRSDSAAVKSSSGHRQLGRTQGA